MALLLHEAARLGDEGAPRVAELLAAGCAVDLRDADGNTPLHIAAEKRSPLAVAALLGAGASHEARNAEGQTPLMRLVTKAPFPPTQVKTEALSLLIASGADVNASDKDRSSPLTQAAHDGKATLVARMLQPDASPDLDARHSDGKSLLEVARLPALRLLLRDHAGSPMARLSRLVASGSMSARRAAAHADGEPLLCARAVLASPDGRGIVSAVTLGSAQLPHATCRLALGGGSPFAPVPVIESLRTFEQRLAGLSLAADAVHGGSTPERDGRHVAVEVLRDLLLVSPADWQPPTDRSSFGVSADDIWLLCDAAEALFRAEPTVLRLQAPMKIFGDTHGQYGDLMRLFTAFGAPSDTGDLCATDYLFIGDYVDRGKHQLEVMCLLLALKVAHPTQVHLLRGNHEIREQNRMQGFRGHCCERLGDDGVRIYERINDLFVWLPLAAVVETPPAYAPGAAPNAVVPPQTRVYCVHGGMARLHLIEDLDAVVRPLLQESTGCSKSVQEELVEDALWSDPAEHDDDPVLQAAGGVAYNAERKTAWSFAPSVVRDFCERNGVSAVVRAHQVPLDGVELFAGGLGVTVFSAANYPEDSDRASNNHAGLLWMGRDGRLHARLLPPQPRVSSA